jgi:DNA-binding LacI/PurR family transcriptional regulator
MVNHGAMSRSRPTLLDVARAAGVSRSTASYAFSRPGRVSDEARRRVVAAAAELGYAGPDPTAASLRRGRVNALGLLFTDSLSYAFTDPAAALFLQGVAREAERADVALTLLPVPPPRGAGLTAVRNSVVDGMLAYALPDDHPALAVVAARRLPVVRVDMPGAPSVGIDDRAGARAAAEHVLALGHRRIAILADRLADTGSPGLADPRRRPAYPVARRRLAGYEDALRAAGLDPAAVPVYACDNPGAAQGRAGAAVLLDLTPRPTAVLAMTDQLARGLVAAAADRGLRVPDDISVVGFDDVPEGDLTTIHQEHTGKGAQAARLLLRSLDEPLYDELVLPTRLIVRGSTARPPRH